MTEMRDYAIDMRDYSYEKKFALKFAGVYYNTISEAISLVFFFLFLFLSCNIPVLMDLYELNNLTYAELLRKCSEVETETSPRKRSFTSLINIQSQG